MPGRGATWREGGHVDETILSEDIKAGTIQESDLDTALTDKINAGGNGGGSSLETSVFEEDFIATQDAQIENRFIVDGLLSTGLFGRYGNVRVDSNSANLGDICQVHTAPSFRTRTVDADFEYESSVRFDSFNSATVLGFVGAIGDPFVNGIEDEADLLAQSTELAGFIADKSVSDNWRIVCQDGGVSTVVQTTTPVSTGFAFLKMIYTKATTSIEFFAGDELASNVVSLGTINTNVPQDQVAFCFLGGNRTSASQAITMDLLKVSTPRDFA